MVKNTAIPGSHPGSSNPVTAGTSAGSYSEPIIDHVAPSDPCRVQTFPYRLKIDHQTILDDYCATMDKGDAQMIRKIVERFLNLSGKSLSDIVTDEYSSEYDCFKSVYESSFQRDINSKKISQKTVYNKISALNKFSVFSHNKINNQSDFTFTATVKMLLDERNLSVHQAGHQSGTLTVLEPLMNGFNGISGIGDARVRRLKQPEKIVILEGYLESLKPGAKGMLTKFLPSYSPVMILGSAETSNRKVLANLVRPENFYRVTVLPKNLQSEWDSVVSHKTKSRISYVDADGEFKVKLIKNTKRWNSKKTISNAFNRLGSFLGFLQKEKNVDLSTISLLDLLKISNLHEYGEFLCSRQNKRETYPTIFVTVLNLVQTLINDSSYSYFACHGAMYAPIAGVREDEWLTWCIKTANKFRSYYDEVEPMFGVDDCDKSIIVGDLLRQSNSLGIMQKVSEAVRNTSSRYKNTSSLYATAMRDYLMFEILLERPLRIGELGLLDIGTTIKKSKATGNWIIHIDKDLLKNRNYSHVEDIYIECSKRLSDLIDDYVDNFRDKIKDTGPKSGLQFSNQFFVFTGSGKPRKIIDISKALSRQFYRFTKRYIPPGFGPHYMRHIWVTQYLNANPHDYAGAAALLNDKEETIRKKYDKRKHVDALPRIENFKESVFGAREDRK